MWLSSLLSCVYREEFLLSPSPSRSSVIILVFPPRVRVYIKVRLEPNGAGRLSSSSAAAEALVSPGPCVNRRTQELFFSWRERQVSALDSAELFVDSFQVFKKKRREKHKTAINCCCCCATAFVLRQTVCPKRCWCDLLISAVWLWLVKVSEAARHCLDYFKKKRTPRCWFLSRRRRRRRVCPSVWTRNSSTGQFVARRSKSFNGQSIGWRLVHLCVCDSTAAAAAADVRRFRIIFINIERC